MTDDQPDFCSYTEFGEAFFERAVTLERIAAGVAGLAGRPIEFGPKGVGPGRLASVTANGTTGTPVVTRVDADVITHDVLIPVSLDFIVDVQVEKHRFHAELEVPLRVTARATRDLWILLDVEPPQSRDVRVDLKAQGLRAGVLQRIGGIDRELCRFVAKYVAREIDKPAVAAARRIDVGAGIDFASGSYIPR